MIVHKDTGVPKYCTSHFVLKWSRWGDFGWTRTGPPRPAKSFETANSLMGGFQVKHWHPWPRYPMHPSTLTFSPPSRPVTPAVVAPVSPTPLTVPSVTSQTQITQAEVQPASDIEEMVTWFVGRNLQALKLSKMITKKHLLYWYYLILLCTVYWYYCTLFCPVGTGIDIGCCGRRLLIVLFEVKIYRCPIVTPILVICQRQLRWNWILSLHRSCKIKGDNNGDWNIPKWKSSYPRQAWSVPLSPVCRRFRIPWNGPFFHVELRDWLRIRGTTKVWLSKSESSAFFETR